MVRHDPHEICVVVLLVLHAIDQGVAIWSHPGTYLVGGIGGIELRDVATCDGNRVKRQAEPLPRLVVVVDGEDDGLSVRRNSHRTRQVIETGRQILDVGVIQIDPEDGR
jgi:hypothetical protein